jgi:hypothetical protein
MTGNFKDRYLFMKSHSLFHPLWPFQLLAIAVLSLTADAATITWNGGSGGQWDDPMNWQPQQVPGAGDTAIIEGTSALVVRIDGYRSVGTLLLTNPNATLRVVGNSGLGSHTELTVANGLENRGIVELTSEGDSERFATLNVTSGSITNVAGGVIRVLEGVGMGGQRQINAHLDNRGRLEVERDLIFSGNVMNNGTVHLADGKTLTFLVPTIWIHRGGAITGAGALSLAGGSTLVLEDDFTPGAFVLNALSLTVNGPGRLLGPATGEFLIRQWTINAEVVVTGTLKIEGSVQFNSALTVAEGKTLRVGGNGYAGMNLANGMENRGILELTSEGDSVPNLMAHVSGGTITNVAGGVIRVLEGTGGQREIYANLDNRGRFEVERDFEFRGTFINSGTVHLSEGTTLMVFVPTSWIHRGGAITGSGTLSLGGGSTFVLEDDFTPGTFVLNAPGLTVNGPGRLLGPATGEFMIRQGTINAEVVVTGGMKVEGAVQFNSALTVAVGKTLRVVANSGVISTTRMFVANGLENRGIIELTSEGDSVRNLTLQVSGTLTNVAGGVIRVLEGNGGQRQIDANLDNRGTLLVMTNTALSLNGALVNASQGILGGGGTLDFSGATLTNEGTIAPGVSPGILTVSGSFPVTAMSHFEAEIGGFTVGTQHDQLKLANPATLGGAIRPVLIDAFFPRKDDAFTVLTYPSRTGTFAALDNPLPERIAWEVRYGPTSAQLVVLNTAPTLAAITNATVNELTSLSVTASATDQDSPAQTLTFSLTEAPAGMTIHPTTGAVTWTPTEAQGPGTHNVTVRVTDNGTPSLGHTTSFNVTVNEVNVAPQLVLPSPRTADEQAETVFTILGTDPDLPANALVYEMVSGPPGATFNAATREFRWTPTEEQGPGSFTAAFRVTDNNPDAVNEKQLSTDTVVTITVNEVNRPPVPANLSGQTVAEESALSVAVIATDPDLPANGLTYSLDRAPAGMTIQPSTGAITWTPTESQGPGTHEVVVRVTDNGVPALSHTTGFTVSVSEVNRPPLLAAIQAATVHAGATFTVTLSATDPDVPANAFTYSLVGGPVGATVSSQGQVAWTLPLAAVGSVADFIVRVTDDGVPSQSDDSTFQVTVAGPVEILSTTRQGAEWTVLWRAVTGNTYRLVGSSSLPAAEWTALPGEVTATGDTASKTIVLEAGTASSFLRVELVR